MKIYIVLPICLLGACGGFTNGQFTQDTHNADKYVDDINAQTDVQNDIEELELIPDIDTDVQKWFDPKELIDANNTVIGKFEYETTNVTQLKAAEILFYRCEYEIGYAAPDPQEVIDTCGCFAHNVYKQAEFKNILYVYEKKQFLPSKRTEYLKSIDKCKTQVRQNIKNKEIERYGEATPDDEFGNDLGQFMLETVENAAWAHKTITDARKRAQESNKTINKE